MKHPDAQLLIPHETEFSTYLVHMYFVPVFGVRLRQIWDNQLPFVRLWDQIFYAVYFFDNEFR